MWPWRGFWHPRAWHGYRMPYGYNYGSYGYPWGAMPKEEAIAMFGELRK